MDVRNLAKKVTRLICTACVDASACGVMAAVVPVAMMNPFVGGMIVIGGAVTAAAISDQFVNPTVDETVDFVADMPEMMKDAKQEFKDIFDAFKRKPDDEKKTTVLRKVPEGKENKQKIQQTIMNHKELARQTPRLPFPQSLYFLPIERRMHFGREN